MHAPLKPSNRSDGVSAMMRGGVGTERATNKAEHSCHEEFAFEVSRTRALVSAFLTQALESSGFAGLAPSHGDILSQLFANDSVTMSELSKRIGRDPSTVTSLVKKLVSLDIARTERDPRDRRSVMVSLTDQGRALASDLDRISVRLRATWVDGIDPDDLETASCVLATMRENLRTAIDVMAGEAEPEESERAQRQRRGRGAASRGQHSEVWARRSTEAVYGAAAGESTNGTSEGRL